MTIPVKYKILNKEGYWIRVLEIKQETNSITIHQLWIKLESELKEFGTYRYSTFDSFKQAYYKQINKKIKP